MIRSLLPADMPKALRLTERTGIFKPLEVRTLEEVLNDLHERNQAFGHQAVGYEQEGKLVGFAYFAPEDMTDRTWNLWWIVVAKELQGAGIGGQLLLYVEEEIRRLQGRVLFIETSSQSSYEPTRRFYIKKGYDQVAVLPDYYAERDDRVIFRKRLA